MPSVALMTFSKSCRSCLSCLNATSLVSRMKSRSINLFASIFAKGALKEMTMFVRRPLAVDDGANLGHLGPGVVGGGLLQEDGAQKYSHSETVTNSISPRKRTHYSYPKSTLFGREGYFEQAQSVEHVTYRRFSCIYPFRLIYFSQLLLVSQFRQCAVLLFNIPGPWHLLPAAAQR